MPKYTISEIHSAISREFYAKDRGMTAREFLAYWTRITLRGHCEDAPERAPEKAVQCLQKRG
jgi:hypothetical protein